VELLFSLFEGSVHFLEFLLHERDILGLLGDFFNQMLYLAFLGLAQMG
jgi:hypothetical protein